VSPNEVRVPVGDPTCQVCNLALETIYITKVNVPDPVAALRREAQLELARNHHAPVKFEVPRKLSTSVATD
jgi:hypothetical protein